MQIVWDPEVVEKLKRSHTVLELETIEQQDGKMITAYCLVPPDKIGLEGFALLDNYKELHEGFVRAYNNKNYTLCEEIAPHIQGKFGGELDSFYEVILGRIKK
ncbi:hypothetical protein UFOVP190_265 [uncultured Caudovirales phage]|uniref:Uncharacterized protein n=1 Tax=uncultured Caudovirales phage TaxID=2100421 RepID=A0A6J7WKR8_9CAUD|nr:hypothetical protein UFOVP190_265 [uncultured Caudovirales phage]